MKVKKGWFNYFGERVHYEYIEYESLDELPNKHEIINKINRQTRKEAIKEKELEVFKGKFPS